ncbi:MAG: hypothetical protein PVI97_05290 [Candidatus Thiodiazotropha sp.]|jgi:steroid 5-alpha reductase family enzyme
MLTAAVEVSLVDLVAVMVAVMAAVVEMVADAKHLFQKDYRPPSDDNR